MITKMPAGAKEKTEHWQEDLQGKVVKSHCWGSGCWWGSAWSPCGMPGLAACPLRAVGVLPLISIGFGSSPWHTACLFWRPSEDKSILSMAALFPSPLVQLLLVPCAIGHARAFCTDKAYALWKALVSLVAMFGALYKWCGPAVGKCCELLDSFSMVKHSALRFTFKRCLYQSSSALV